MNRQIIKYKIIKRIPDETYLKLLFWITMKRKLHLKNPVTFNEKLQWLKLHDRNPNYTYLVDKYEVRKYVEKKIGNEILVPLVGVWNTWEEIDFDILPERFVLKTTHDSGGVVICRNRADWNIEKAQKKLMDSLSRNFFYIGREYPYKDIVPRIIGEEYMENEQAGELIDYKVMCFNGKARCIFTCTERFTEEGLKVTFFDLNWNRLPFTRHYPCSNVEIKRPENLEKMIQYAEILSEGIPFLRVDFYEVNDRIYMGELTFYPGGGIEEFEPEEYDSILGSWLELPQTQFHGSNLAN